jgi:hypothetical protein
MRFLLEAAHNNSHSYIGGTIGDPHTSFRDPFVFLLHSNVDRLFARWQTDPAHPWRLDPNQVYGSEGNTTGLRGITTPLDPWAGNPSNDPAIQRVRPWAPPENQQVVKNWKHPTVVTPPVYDTNLIGRPSGRVMVADFSSGVPAQVRYWENWGQSNLLNGWHDAEDLQTVGSFMGPGRQQLLFLNRSP